MSNSVLFLVPMAIPSDESVPCGVMLDRTAMALTKALEALRETHPNHHPARVEARKALDAWVEWSAHSGGSQS